MIFPATRYNETFEFDVSNPASVLGLECWEKDTFSNNYVGAINIPLRELSDGKKVNLGYSCFRTDQHDSRQASVVI